WYNCAVRQLKDPLLIVILVLSIALGSSYLTRGQDWGDDFAAYIMQAKSIVQGNIPEFIQHNSFTINTSSETVGITAYPWGYPLIIAPVYAIAGLDLIALKLPTLLFYAGFLVCLFFLMRRKLDRGKSLLIVALFAFNPIYLQILDQILSDIPFLFFSTLALLLMDLYEDDHQAVFAWALGPIIFVAFFIRTTGILLLAAFSLGQVIQIIRHRSDPALIRSIIRSTLIVWLVFGVLGLLSARIFPGSSESYISDLVNFSAATFLNNLSSYFQLFGSFFGTDTASTLIYYFAVVFFVLGLWVRKKSDENFIIYFFIVVASLIVWPYFQGIRLILPLLPLFLYFALQGLSLAVEHLARKRYQFGRVVFYGFGLLIVLSFFITSTAHAYTNIRNDRQVSGPFDEYSIQTYGFIKNETPADSVIIFFKPRVLRLMTGHDTFESTKCQPMYLGDYLVLVKGPSKYRQIPAGMIGMCHLDLQQVFENEVFVAYRIQK
ncbi:MAG TPA: glycosyltransferase family 39 protein, partial [Longilinea sp.]|nr:glycosyltransferase family 39 protein [Longilinea sp.]